MAPPLLSRCSAVALFVLLSKLGTAIPYTPTQIYSGATFFDAFDFITSDPSGGWVSYVDQGTAQGLGYASASAGGAILGVDSTSYLDPAGAGRRAVRIESKLSFNKGLFIGDFARMPSGCGTWPSFWMYGPNWPNSGEIDIIEGVNNQVANQISGHTGAGCTIAGTNSLATLVQDVCYQPTDNSGCYYKAKGIYTYGDNFNSVGGGVYAMQWTDNWISIWFWRRSNIPANVQNNTPDPATWGRPMAMFAGSGCSIDNHFANMKIVVNTDFCGPWGGNTFASQGCGASCINYVAGNPNAFANTFWHINSIKVFQPAYPNARIQQLPEPTNGTVPDASSFSDSTTPDATTFSTSATPTATDALPSVFLPSSLLSFSTATPLASIISISAPDAANGANSSVMIGPTPNPTSTPALITSLVSNPPTTRATATPTPTPTSAGLVFDARFY